MRLEAERGLEAGFTRAWAEWSAFLGSMPNELAVLGTSSNPEIILSLADLFDAAAEGEDRQRTVGAIQHYKNTGESTVTDLERYFDSPERGFLSSAQIGRARLLYALDLFFRFKHIADQHAEASTRGYLAGLIADLGPGDAVLTFNWDSLVERLLLETGRWFPADGFGFARQLLVDHQFGRRRRRRPLEATLYRPSDVLVLKLHGSFGWRLAGDGIFLDGPEYLDGFDFMLGGSRLFLRDSEQPESYSPTDPLVAYPSFLKRLSHPLLEAIWSTASARLATADVVQVIGYSLPPSDGAARALLLPLAARCRAQAVRVIVRDPSDRTLDNWRSFLGPCAEYRKEGIGAGGSA
jgi:hypothetical protein